MTIRLCRSFWLLAGLLLEAGSAAAAGEPGEVLPEVAPLRLRIEASGLGVNERSVRQAIAHELRLDSDTDTGPPGQAAPVEIGLRVVPGGELTVTIRAAGPPSSIRSTATTLPGSPSATASTSTAASSTPTSTIRIARRAGTTARAPSICATACSPACR